MFPNFKIGPEALKYFESAYQLQNTFSKLDLVTREEFDAQKGVLQRTREKLETLEEQVKTMEGKNDSRNNT